MASRISVGQYTTGEVYQGNSPGELGGSSTTESSGHTAIMVEKKKNSIF